ncbi:MAG: hypothetical protein OXG81_08945 [Acidobacteria bacterium]|nr:hypothetical protein [Acidobacteriota bacterium]
MASISPQRLEKSWTPAASARDPFCRVVREEPGRTLSTRTGV